MNKEKKNYIYILNSKDALELYEEAIKIGIERGRKPEEDIGDIFLELADKRGIEVDCVGYTNQDAGLLTGNLREEGKKILNINEEMRKKNNEKNS